jgi:peptidoglycan/LPS O-acetylase OafA/YrhL
MYGTLNSRVWPEFHFALGDSISLACIAATMWRVIHWEDTAHRILNTKFLVVIGTLSYSLYIWQQIFLNAEASYWVNVFPQNLVLAFATAAASYYLVESPILRWRATVVKWIRARRGRAAAGEGTLSVTRAEQEVANQVSA